MICPKCNRQIEPGEVTWPVSVDGRVEVGGCPDCWEAQAEAAWWDAVERKQFDPLAAQRSPAWLAVRVNLLSYLVRLLLALARVHIAAAALLHRLATRTIWKAAVLAREVQR
jgi:hypothetical protein